MDRCALFVDAGYVLADGAMAVHGTRRRESVSWDYGGLLQLLASQAMGRSRLPLLRCYWYETTVEGQRNDDHEALADLPGVKLRVAKMWPGRREGAEIQRDLTTLARNKAVSDAMVVSAEENLAQVISDVQDMGMRVTLLNIAVEGDAPISRALRQECDDIVEISSLHLRPYVELIPGAEPPRADERDGALVAIRPANDRNGNGTSGNGTNGNGHGPAARAATYSMPSARPQPSAATYAAPAESEYAEYPDYQRDLGQQDHADSAAAGGGTSDTAAGYAVADYVGGGEFGADYGSAPEYGQQPTEYGQHTEYAPAARDTGVPTQEPMPLRQDQAILRQETLTGAQERIAVPEAQPGRQDYGVRRGAPRPELTPPTVREEQYGAAAPVAVPAAAEDPGVERPSARPPRQEADSLRHAESGYNPGAIREQFQADAMIREPVAGDGADRYQPVPVPVPVPSNSAQIRRFPTRVPGQAGSAVGQPEPVAGPPSGAQAVAPSVPIEARGMGYPGTRGGSYGGPRSVGAGSGSPGSPGSAPAGGPVGFSDQPSNGSAPSGPPIPMTPMGQQPVPVGPGDGGARQQSGLGSGPYPAQGHSPSTGPAALVPAAAPAYSGGQSGASLADAVQSAHEEGQAFGDSVARDAPALWLEAVLARKPRMPSDLEARLLQGSSLPIDFLLHDEVRHALRRGFWDALERSRR